MTPPVSQTMPTVSLIFGVLAPLMASPRGGAFILPDRDGPKPISCRHSLKKTDQRTLSEWGSFNIPSAPLFASDAILRLIDNFSNTDRALRSSMVLSSDIAK
jgi:hypothetical protein